VRRRLLYPPKRLPTRRPRRMRAGWRLGRPVMKKYRASLVLLIGLLLLVGFVLLFEFRLGPVVKQLALARVTYLAGKVINDAINEQIEQDFTQFEDLITFHKTTDGKITAYTPNYGRINLLKVKIVANVLEKINNMDTTQLKIPLGNILNGEILSGVGPRIPIKLLPVATADAKFATAFTSAGINQTRHQIIVEVTVDIGVVLPGLRTGTEVTSQVNIAETIIVGNVPNTYTYLEDTGMSPFEIYGDIDLYGDRAND
jgi:sporulation protein YunB